MMKIFHTILAALVALAFVSCNTKTDSKIVESNSASAVEEDEYVHITDFPRKVEAADQEKYGYTHIIVDNHGSAIVCQRYEDGSYNEQTLLFTFDHEGVPILIGENSDILTSIYAYRSNGKRHICYGKGVNPTIIQIELIGVGLKKKRLKEILRAPHTFANAKEASGQ